MINMIIEDSVKRAPNEACGFLLEDEYMPLDNISSRPVDTFLVDPKMYLRLYKRIIAIVHSHPQGGPPSLQDVGSCNAGTIPWIVYDFSQFHIIYPKEYLDIGRRDSLHYLLEREGLKHDNIKSTWAFRT